MAELFAPRMVSTDFGSQESGYPEVVDTKASTSVSQNSLKITIVDLNNFATFPTLAIGILVAKLRQAGHQVSVFCPLNLNVVTPSREGRETAMDHLKRRVHLSTNPLFRKPRNILRQLRNIAIQRPNPVVLREVVRSLDNRPDVLLLSAYLQHYATVREIGLLAASRGVPVLLGGPMFSLASVAKAWSDLPGIAGIVGAEVDHDLPRIVEAVSNRADISLVAGVTTPDGKRKADARPLRNLNDGPVPDFTDFPWQHYPVRVVPIMTGRGCQWDKCLFCSDVISTSGRTFRTRSVENVLDEMREQARRHSTRNFLFLDLKLNSYPDMLSGIASGIQAVVPGAEWIGTVHVDQRKDNGLSFSELQAMVAGGMRRISFGLESGSQRLLDLMQKGSTVEANAEFLRNAFQAGLSVRCTMFKGYPGESVEDMVATAQFLEKHSTYLDRVRFNDFSLMQDTPIYQQLMLSRDTHANGMKNPANDVRALALFDNPAGQDIGYRRAKARVLRAVYSINRRPLREEARQFDGLM